MQPDLDNWHYSDEAPNGPRDWPRFYRAGESQSPINILVDYCYDPFYQQAATESQGSANSTNQQKRDSHNLLTWELEKKLDLGHHSRRQHQHLSRHHPEKQHQHQHQHNHLHHQHNHHHHHQHRRDHLDSVGNDDDAKDLDFETQHSRSPSNASDDGGGGGGGEATRATNLFCKSQELARLRKSRAALHDRLQETHYCFTNKKIFLGYPRYLNSVTLSNTGHGWQVDVAPELAAHTLLCGPPFNGREYRLAQFHAHWGATCDSGSEHQINGRTFSAELHFVHWNCGQYTSLEEAAKHKHGLAVLGVFVQALEGEHNRNKHLEKILAAMEHVRDQPNSSVAVRDCRLDLKKLFPADRWSYATYDGSLTTPPLSECVHWLVFLKPITCSTSQLEQFRQLKCAQGSLTRNFRPVQPLNKRTVSIWSHASGGGAGGGGGGGTRP